MAWGIYCNNGGLYSLNPRPYILDTSGGLYADRRLVAWKFARKEGLGNFRRVKVSSTVHSKVETMGP